MLAERSKLDLRGLSKTPFFSGAIPLGFQNGRCWNPKSLPNGTLGTHPFGTPRGGSRFEFSYNHPVLWGFYRAKLEGSHQFHQPGFYGMSAKAS